jgi:hypothetical protein
VPPRPQSRVVLAAVLLGSLLFASVVPGATAGSSPIPLQSSTAGESESIDRPASNASAPAIVAVYPNPVASGDAGEFVVVAFSERTTLSAWALTDGETTVSLVDATASRAAATAPALRENATASSSESTSSPSTRPVAGTVAFSTAPERTRNLTDRRVRALTESFSMSNSGERVELRRAGASTVGKASVVADSAT